MEVVTGQPQFYPHRCGVLPFPNISTDPSMRFVDTGQDYIQGGQYERLYVSEPALKEMARLLGFPTRDEHIQVLAELAAAKAKLEDAQAQLAEADSELDKISYLKGRGYQPVKRQGRPPTKKAA